MSSQQNHFSVMLVLMMFFFVVDYAADFAFLFGYTTAKVGNGLSRDAFMACWGVAMGIFRGMPPAKDGPASSST